MNRMSLNNIKLPEHIKLFLRLGVQTHFIHEKCVQKTDVQSSCINKQNLDVLTNFYFFYL